MHQVIQDDVYCRLRCIRSNQIKQTIHGPLAPTRLLTHRLDHLHLYGLIWRHRINTITENQCQYCNILRMQIVMRIFVLIIMIRSFTNTNRKKERPSWCNKCDSFHFDFHLEIDYFISQIAANSIEWSK